MVGENTFEKQASLKFIRHPTQRAPDWWESARFQAVFVAWSWFRQNGVVSSRPPAGNASRWAAMPRNKERKVKDIKSLAWLLPAAGLLILVGWFLGRQGWSVSKLTPPGIELVPPTATVASQSIQPSQPIATSQSAQALVALSPTSAVVQGKYPCPLVINQSEVDRWKVGQTSVPAVQEAINQFDAKRSYNEGAFVKGTTIPSGVIVATNFDERDANAWTRYPVVPLIHSGSWGLFQTTGEYVAPNDGACMTIVP